MEKDVGYRRAQLTGRGSYIISLPKDWVQEVGVERGSQIAFKVQNDSSLILTPRKILEGRKESEKPTLKEYRVLVEPKDDPKSVCRRITSLYVVNADLIHVRYVQGGVAPRFRGAINDLVKNVLLGSEIIDEKPNELTIQILINHPEFPVEKAIRRMAVLALSANKDAVSTLSNKNEGLIPEVIEVANDVNRLNLYAVRQLKYGMERNLFKELGFRTPKEFLGYRIVANDLKNIADNARNIVRKVTTFKEMIRNQTLFLKEAVDEEVYSQILDYNSLAHKLLEDSLKAMFKRDYEQADRIIFEVESIAKRENDLIVLISSKKMDPNISSILSLILDTSRRIVEYSQNIAEVTLNRTIEEVSAQNP